MTGRWALQTGFAVLVIATAAQATAAEPVNQSRIYTLVVGNNEVPLANHQGPTLAPTLSRLHYADDDAAAFYDFLSPLTDDGHLLTVMDRETQVAFPRLAEVARPPTLAELRQAVRAVAARVRADHDRGDRSIVYLFFSGHGSANATGEPELALLDAGISRRFLYGEILDQLTADFVHLIVDACHAEEVVRPRDVQAKPVDVSAASASAFATASSLARYPRVGAIIAASAVRQTHEWDAIRHGIFSYGLLSALRGAGDVNHDGQIEYSEAYAFIAAANLGVVDPRARLDVIARPPELNRRVALVELARFPKPATARLVNVPARAGLIEIGATDGRRLASMRGEQGFLADLVLPAAVGLYLRTETGEARIDAPANGTVAFDELRLGAHEGRPRGALADALTRGLFATPYGRGYYTGLMDGSRAFVPVRFAAPLLADDVAGAVAMPATRAQDHHGSHVALLVAAGLSTPVADDLGTSFGLRLGARPVARTGGFATVDLLRAARGAYGEWQGIASVGWLWGARLSILCIRAGAAAGGGVVVQTVDGARKRWSGAGVAGPVVSMMVDLPLGLALWGEAQAMGYLVRRDDRLAAVWSPLLWLGMSLAL